MNALTHPKPCCRNLWPAAGQDSDSLRLAARVDSFGVIELHKCRECGTLVVLRGYCKQSIRSEDEPVAETANYTMPGAYQDTERLLWFLYGVCPAHVDLLYGRADEVRRWRELKALLGEAE